MISKQLTVLLYKTQTTSLKQLLLSSQKLYQQQANSESSQISKSLIQKMMTDDELENAQTKLI